MVQPRFDITIPEAMVGGHRCAEPVLRAEFDEVGDEEAVVEDVSVGQHSTFGDPVVPEVYWMLIGSVGLRCQHRSKGFVRDVSDRARSDSSPGVEEDDFGQIRNFRTHLVDHGAIVGRLESACRRLESRNAACPSTYVSSWLR